ncbi:hypothetical protein PIB30_102729, partial [Stylosanthes scabra]|nr:hypothetical protein [Stylosanthes scabra]
MDSRSSNVLAATFNQNRRFEPIFDPVVLVNDVSKCCLPYFFNAHNGNQRRNTTFTT